MIKVKLLRSTLSRTEDGQRVKYTTGDVFEATEQELKSFGDNLEIIEEQKSEKKANNGQEDSSKLEDKEENAQFTEEELENKNVTGDDGLRSIASELEINGYTNMKKKELIKAILEAQEE